jgi:PAS domain S-box-containing protein
MNLSRNSLGAYLALAFTLLSVALTLLLTAYSDRAASSRIRASIGNNLAELSNQTTSRLDRSMFERYREVRLMAERLSGISDLAVVRKELDALQQSYPRYAWIGLTDAQGRVNAATRGMLEGADVSGRLWFQNALKNIHMGDVHDALLLAKLLGASDGAPLRFVDIAFPITDAGGQVTNVLGAHLSWQWAQDIEHEIFVPVGRSRTIDPVIVSSTGTVLLGPAALMGQALDLPSVAAAQRNERGHVRETWPDGREYLVGYSRDQGFDAYPGLGWRVLVRQDAEEAFAPVNQLHQRMLVGGFVLAALFSLLGWLVARRITQPLQDLADVARGIEAGYAVKARSTGVYDEVATLGRAFNSLIAKLQQNEAEVRQLNVSLERRVQERTAEYEANIEQLLESQARLQTVIETTQDPFIATDFEGHITEWNSPAERLFGWQRNEVLGQLLPDIVLPERHQDVFIKAVAHFLTTGHAPFADQTLERTLVKRDGTEVLVAMKIRLIHTDQLQLFSAFLQVIADPAPSAESR